MPPPRFRFLATSLTDASEVMKMNFIIARSLPAP
jgi:hypothetical protein